MSSPERTRMVVDSKANLGPLEQTQSRREPPALCGARAKGHSASKSENQFEGAHLRVAERADRDTNLTTRRLSDTCAALGLRLAEVCVAAPEPTKRLCEMSRFLFGSHVVAGKNTHGSGFESESWAT